MRAKTPEERAHVDLDSHYTQVILFFTWEVVWRNANLNFLAHSLLMGMIKQWLRVRDVVVQDYLDTLVGEEYRRAILYKVTLDRDVL